MYNQIKTDNREKVQLNEKKYTNRDI